jgi:hypothetical protein
MDEHRESCGSRTEECDNCKRRILVKDLENHLAAGCEMPAKTTGQDEGKRGMPEKLIGSPDDLRPRGLGFPFHPQFQPYPYSDEKVENPYFPSAQTYSNNDSPKLPRTLPKKSTPASSLTSSPKSISQRNKSLGSGGQRFNAMNSRAETWKPSVSFERRMEQKRPSASPKTTAYTMSSSDSDSTDEAMEG